MRARIALQSAFFSRLTLVLVLGLLFVTATSGTEEANAQTSSPESFSCSGADLNGDGIVGVPDFLLFGQCMADPTYAPPTEGVLGPSDQLVKGARPFDQTGACIATFGEDARVCRSVDLINMPTPLWAPGPDERMWVRAWYSGGLEATTGLPPVGCQADLTLFNDGDSLFFNPGPSCSNLFPVVCCR